MIQFKTPSRQRLALLLTAWVALVAGTCSQRAMGADPEQISVGDFPPQFLLQVIDREAGVSAGEETMAFPDAFLEKAPILVVTYWSTWCPSCRASLMLDEAAHEQKELLRIAVSPEDPERLRQFANDAGWRDHVIAADLDRVAFRSMLLASRDGQADEPVLPYTWIVGSPGRASRALASPDSRTAPVLLWCGRTAVPEVEAPRAELERVLETIVQGRFDVSAERTAQAERRSCTARLDELTRHVAADDVVQVTATLEILESCAAPTARSRAIVAFMNEFAWAWATRDGRTETHLRIAERMCRLALKHGGERDPFFLDTYAKVLHDLGRLEEAIATQRRAVESLDSGAAEELRTTLDAYLVEAQLPPSKGSDPALQPSPRWNRNLNAVWDAAPPAEIVLIHPADAEWAKEAKAVQERFLPGATLRTPDTLREDERRQVLVLYGTPNANAVTRAVLERHGISITSAGVQVGARLLEQAHPVLITAVPNPWNEALPVCIYAAGEDANAHNANRIFHGPTSLVVGTWEHGEPEGVFALDYVADSEPLRLRIGEILTGAEASSDLESLSHLLQTSYAGFADLEWKIIQGGSSWEARDREFKLRVAKQRQLSWSQFYDLAREYLAEVQDSHFSLRGTGIENGRVITRTDRLVETLEPYFADLRVDSRQGRLSVVASDSTLNGSELLELTIVPTPHAVRPREPYLFPTLPAAVTGQVERAEARTFLIGTLADPRDPPGEVRVRLLDPMGRTNEVALPVHRGRVPLAESGAAWKVSGVGEIDPAEGTNDVAVLAVRTMVGNRLHGMAETAATLREEQAVALDLRANGGGGDQPAMHWCQQFSGQSFEWIAAVVRLPGAWNPLQSTLSIAGRSRDSLLGPTFPRAEEPYAGRLFVIWDHGTASSGETFSHLAAQVRGAVSIGENSAGCVSYGNLEEHILPESGIQLTFGRSRFVVDWVRPVAEGVGLFPDYWLDTPDPIAEIERVLRTQ